MEFGQLEQLVGYGEGGGFFAGLDCLVAVVFAHLSGNLAVGDLLAAGFDQRLFPSVEYAAHHFERRRFAG